MTSICRLCKERGKVWEGDEPKCAFQNKVFDSDNWNCATMNAIRDLADELDSSTWHEDQYAALIPIGESEFLIIGWYKRRGRTEYAGILDGYEIKPLTLEDAEKAISGGLNE